MNKNELFIKCLFVFLLLGLLHIDLNAQNTNKILSLKPVRDNDEIRLREAEKILKKKNAVFNLDVDIQLGLGIANTSNELNKVDSNTENLQNTDTKVGPAIGAIVNIDFLGFGFTTGMVYSSKGFKHGVNTVANEQAGTVSSTLNYLNIPLLFYIGIDAGKILIDLNFGPYFGLLLSQDETTYYKVKNFDFGLTGDLSGAYMFNKYMGVLLGLKYEYGGLNNLQSNEYIKKTTTSTFLIYSGLKFVI